MRQILAVFSLLCIVFAAQSAAAAQNPAEGYARGLFPQSAGWLTLEELPFPRELANPATAAEMELARAMAGDFAAEFCPDYEADPRYLFTDYGSDRFRKHDLNGDGLPDIFYTGHLPCREGTVSLVWFATPEGGFETNADSAFDGLILLVQQAEPEQAARFVTFNPGCCGAMLNVYSLGDIDDPEAESRATTNWLRDPTQFLHEVWQGVAGVRVHVPGLLVLRLGPEFSNVYAPDISEDWDMIVLGNVQAIYASQDFETMFAPAARLLAWSDDGEWGLLALDADHPLDELFGSGGEQDAELGWAHKSQFRQLE